MLTIVEAAEELGLSVATLRSWTGQRKLAVHRLGRAVRIDRDEIERLIAEFNRFQPYRTAPGDERHRGYVSKREREKESDTF